MNPDRSISLNRRDLMLWAGAMAAPGMIAAERHADTGDRDPWMDDPERSYINYVRMMGDASGRLSPQWWRGGYMGIFGDKNPELLFRLESCEMKRCIRRSEFEYEFQIRLMTMFLDPVTGEILHGKRWRNPGTGEEVIVEPNISGADSFVRLRDDGVIETQRPEGDKLAAAIWWSAQGPYVMANVERERPEERRIPLTDYLTLFGDRAAAADFAAPRLEVRFTNTFVAPFQRFMNTSTDVGFSVWHASGHKADDVAGLPKRYRDELAHYRPELKDWIGEG